MSGEADLDAPVGESLVEFRGDLSEELEQGRGHGSHHGVGEALGDECGCVVSERCDADQVIAHRSDDVRDPHRHTL